jgi:hypothetical protein
LQFEAPGRVSRASQLYGAIGIVIVALSWFFIIGRLFVASFTINAVVYERFGSLTTWLLRWRRLRRTVEHHPKLEHFLLAGGEARAPDEGEVDLRDRVDTRERSEVGAEKEVGRR